MPSSRTCPLPTLFLALLIASGAACGTDKSKAWPPAGGDVGGDTAWDDCGGCDSDADGYTVEDGDCDDTDATIFPDATEVCDGIDQDCDGEIDDGVPNDGAGCADPGWPEFDGVAEIVHLTLRTGTGTYDGTNDGGVEVCLGPDHCLSPYKPEWNDLEPGIVDVSAFEGLDWTVADLDRFSVGTDDGSNMWRPVGFQVSLDGETVYCHQEEISIGNDDDETLSWTDPDGLATPCDTVFDSPLTHGPMIGAVDDGSARIWFRTDATRQVVLRVAESETALASSAPVATRYPAADKDFTQVVAVGGLLPEQRYVYSLEILGTTYGPWELHTAPSQGAGGALRLAFGSCSKTDDQPVFGAIHAYDPDVFLFVGDNHYGNTDDLSDLRQYYRWAHERSLRAELLAETSIMATWDDHDYVGNNTDGTAEGKDVALRVFSEYWANPSAGTDDVPGVFFHHRWGDVEVFMVDDRYHRGLDGTFLGEAQHAWLVDALAESTATFKLVASGSQFTPYGSSDSWAAYPESIDHLLEGIVTHDVHGVVLLSGDIHRLELRSLDPADGGYALPELTSSSLAYTAASSCNDDADEPDRLFCLGEIGFIGMDIDPGADDPQIDVTVRDVDGVEQGSWTLWLSELGG